jgi:hypothetical protein
MIDWSGASRACCSSFVMSTMKTAIPLISAFHGRGGFVWRWLEDHLTDRAGCQSIRLCTESGDAPATGANARMTPRVVEPALGASTRISHCYVGVGDPLHQTLAREEARKRASPEVRRRSRTVGS